MINDFLARMPEFEQDIIYKLIAYQDLKLCLDVGAAAGWITRWIKEAGSDYTKVIGFEPFPGNHDHFLNHTKELTNVELVKKAAHSKTGTCDFRVLSTVQGHEKGWERLIGYSSTGFLIDSEEHESTVSTGKGAQELTVDTIAISDIVNTHVDFMKIDVQGSEYEVLLGCEPVIRNHGIDVMYVEFDGDRRIVEFLNSFGYSIFDTDYLLFPKKVDLPLLESIGFYDFNILNLSVGHKAYRAKLNLNSGDYCDFFKNFRKNYGYIYTDLICVSKEFLMSFIMHVGLLSEHNTLGFFSARERSTMNSLDESIENFRSNCEIFS